MAEDEDGVSNKKSSENSNNVGPSQENTHASVKPDLGIEETKYNSNENGDTSPTEPRSSSSKSTGATRKEDNPFSFRHFLKRDLSLPGNSTYENTGARPKVYANTVQHSPTKIDVHTESRREKSRSVDTQAKEKPNDASCHRISDITSSSSSVEIPFSVVDNSESKHNLYSESSEAPFYHRPNLASEPLGMPSLPDFVQDHILVEQAYLNSNGPISVDLDNLPDFTFNTNYNDGFSSSSSRRNKINYDGNRDYGYDAYAGAASTSRSGSSPSRGIPLDLPAGAEAAGPMPLDLPAHLSLDLTESVNPADRRNVSPRNTFPLDLPTSAGAESMRLPDFLPQRAGRASPDFLPHPGRTSPEPEHADAQLQQVLSELERSRSELFAERSLRSRLEDELSSMRAAAAILRAEVARDKERAAREREEERSREGQAARDREGEGERARESVAGGAGGVAGGAGTSRGEPGAAGTQANDPESENLVSKLKNQIKQLKEELAASQSEAQALRAVQSRAASDLRRASARAETSLRDLLSGIEQLRTLSSALDPT